MVPWRLWSKTLFCLEHFSLWFRIRVRCAVAGGWGKDRQTGARAGDSGFGRTRVVGPPNSPTDRPTDRDRGLPSLCSRWSCIVIRALNEFYLPRPSLPRPCGQEQDRWQKAASIAASASIEAREGGPVKNLGQCGPRKGQVQQQVRQVSLAINF